MVVSSAIQVVTAFSVNQAIISSVVGPITFALPAIMLFQPVPSVKITQSAFNVKVVTIWIHSIIPVFLVLIL
jgi:hypothetical protein